MKRPFLIIFAISSLFISGCGSKDAVINNQQKQLDELFSKINNMATLTEQNKIIEKLTVNELLLQIEGLKSQIAQQQTISNSKIINSYLPKTVKLWCAIKGIEGLNNGSGFITSKTGKITTNQHIAKYVGNICAVGLTTSVDISPTDLYFAKVIDTYETIDLASLQIIDKFDEQNPTINGQFDYLALDLPYILRSDFCQRSNVQIGDELTVIGYPGVGGLTITATEGIVSGFEDMYIKTSAKIAHGNAGGLVIHESGCVLGVPVEVNKDDLESLGRIIDFTISSDVIGSDNHGIGNYEKTNM